MSFSPICSLTQVLWIHWIDPSWSKRTWLRRKNHQNLIMEILSQLSQSCFASWHFHMLQRIILGIFCAIKTFMNNYLKQFNNNITSQLMSGFLIMELGSVFSQERQVNFLLSSFERKFPLIWWTIKHQQLKPLITLLQASWNYPSLI